MAKINFYDNQFNQLTKSITVSNTNGSLTKKIINNVRIDNGLIPKLRFSMPSSPKNIEIETVNSYSDLYNSDFVAWVERTSDLLKARKLKNLDIENLIEEVEDLGKSQKLSLKSRLRVLLMHLLKWQYQPSRRSYPESSNEWHENSWSRTISTQRDDIQDLLVDSPSLYNYLSEVLSDSYKRARENASEETRINLSDFPESCPYTEAQILNKDFWPEAE